MAAVAMHALLVFGLWFAVQWRTSSEAPAIAELWEPLAPVEPAAPPPPPPAPPQPEAAKPDADIVQKQQVKPHAPEQESPPPIERRPIEKVKPEPKKVEPKKKVETKPTPEQIAREEHLAEERRQQELARLSSEATGTARTPFASTGAISNAYSALIKACIRPHIVFAVPEGTSDQIYAEFQVQLLPTGEQKVQPQLTKPSGLAGYDDAAARAIIQCDPFPRDKDGTVPQTFTLKMYPTETR
jgi:colicin import membrane protein